MNKIAAGFAEKNIKCLSDFDVKNLTSFKVGGKVAGLITVNDVAELMFAAAFLRKHKKKFAVVGKWTNMLVSDKGVKKYFISLRGDFEKARIKDGGGFYAGAGLTVYNLLKFAVGNRLGGLEYMAGIPGTLGGALYMNAGAKKKAIGDVVDAVYVLNKKSEVRKIDAKKCKFGYRSSAFLGKDDILLGADLSLKEVNVNESLALIQENMKDRAAKQPLDLPNAGSIFRNGDKYTAGALIDKAGLKGLKIGGAKVSEKHANFIVNEGGATYADVKALIEKVKKEIKKKYKIKLEEEILYVE